MGRTVALLSLLITFNLLMVSESYVEDHDDDDDDFFEKLIDREFFNSIIEAKQKVDQAFILSRERLKVSLKKDDLHPSDFLKYLKTPVAGTRTAIRAASYMETALNLLEKKIQNKHLGPLNVTDILSKQQKETLSRKTGCDYVIRPIRCPLYSPYRTITGECNNREHPHFGVANHAYARWLPAEYEDGISLPRGLIAGQLYHGHPLPLVRLVSNEIITTSNENVTPDDQRSLVFMHFGQWIDHDLDLAPESPANIDNVHCDSCCNYAPPDFPIKIPPGDPRIKTPGICLPFVRTAAVCNPTTFVREQLNAITSFMDASAVYGSEEPLARSLRNQTNSLGLMAINQNFTDAGLSLLPFEINSNSLCLHTNKTAQIPCFKAGDARVDENLGLIAIHTLFLREHNRIAGELKKLNPHWNGERLYQETRKIIGALNQIFTYRDYLPLLLGNEFYKRLPAYRGYNKNVDPSISNVFSLAFRFGHGSVPPFVPRLDEKFQNSLPFSKTPLHLTFMAPWRIVAEGGIDPIVRGFMADYAKLMRQDQMMVEELQERLFEQLHYIGLDLSALNLQRGRDHGLPGYNAWRRFCGLSAPSNEAQLAVVLRNHKLAKQFIKLYGTPENIDIWIGAMAEPFVPNGRVGPLMACLIGTQFRKLRDGDRYWWENRGVFTSWQRRALRSDSFSRVICDNTHIKEVSREIFRMNRYPRDFVSCYKIESLDLSAWKE
ncbi:eosinophil peroxidase-like [Pituophis catenifer annectens]|uniref:eosinophil peroxidase-like n=1 Tax=Pituophis catenifer annectens TaxID=94852 RepID=UPI003993FF80